MDSKSLWMAMYGWEKWHLKNYIIFNGNLRGFFFIFVSITLDIRGEKKKEKFNIFFFYWSYKIFTK